MEGEAQFLQTLKSLRYAKFKLKKNKNISKSGSFRKSSDKAIYHVAWPHEFAGSDDIEFTSLSIPALVRGENYIIHHVEPSEYRDKRAEHLTQLMFYSEQFIWSDVLAFHKDVLKKSKQVVHPGMIILILSNHVFYINHTPNIIVLLTTRERAIRKRHTKTLGLLEQHFCSSCWIKRTSIRQHPAKDCQKQSRDRGTDGNLPQQDRDFIRQGRGRGADGFGQNWQQDRR